MAEFLNHFENHRTDSDFEDSLVVKTFLFQFVNSNAAIFYSAFVTRDYVATNIQIATVIISKQAIDLATTAILPMIMNMFQRREFDANMQKKDSNTAHQRRMSTIGTSPNKQGSASKYSVSSSKTTMKKMPKRFAGQRDGCNLLSSRVSANNIQHRRAGRVFRPRCSERDSQLDQGPKLPIA